MWTFVLFATSRTVFTSTKFPLSSIKPAFTIFASNKPMTKFNQVSSSMSVHMKKNGIYLVAVYVALASGRIVSQEESRWVKEVNVFHDDCALERNKKTLLVVW